MPSRGMAAERIGRVRVETIGRLLSIKLPEPRTCRGALAFGDAAQAASVKIPRARRPVPTLEHTGDRVNNKKSTKFKCCY
jgi:hypothetical protein